MGSLWDRTKVMTLTEETLCMADRKHAKLALGILETLMVLSITLSE
jgi:hypothetical protein